MSNTIPEVTTTTATTSTTSTTSTADHHRAMSPEPSHITTGDYVVLMETNGQEYESWYNFIRVHGNEKALEKLHKQLEQVDWYIVDDLSTFDLDLEHKVCARTAKEMTKLELNSHMFHRKFDGRLRDIDFGFEKIEKKKKKKDATTINEAKICRAFDILGMGQIDEFISDEDIDPEDLVSDSESSSDDDSSSDESSSSNDKEKKKQEKKEKQVSVKAIPKSLAQPTRSELPGWIKKKKRGEK